MRSFNFFLYDNYDTTDVKNPADDPRAAFGKAADLVLTKVTETRPGECSYEMLCRDGSTQAADTLIHIGLLRRENNAVFLDSPVLVREDVPCLQNCFSDHLRRMEEALWQRRDDFYRLAGELNNGFPPEHNLYHVLCGTILDGSFFAYISDHELVSTSRLHASGLDYLIIAYEQAPALDLFSQKLLCSYNRYSDGTRAFQSFGDANGDRVDFFRFARQKEAGKVPAALSDIERLWDTLPKENPKNRLLDEMQQFVETGCCEETCFRLMSLFGYIHNGRLAVPVYRAAQMPVMDALERLTEECLYTEVRSALSTPQLTSSLLCSRHGVSAKEIANELYHVLFGQLNERLVSSGFVAKPQEFSGEGRYLQSIQFTGNS